MFNKYTLYLLPIVTSKTYQHYLQLGLLNCYLDETHSKLTIVCNNYEEVVTIKNKQGVNLIINEKYNKLTSLLKHKILQYWISDCVKTQVRTSLGVHINRNRTITKQGSSAIFFSPSLDCSY